MTSCTGVGYPGVLQIESSMRYDSEFFNQLMGNSRGWVSEVYTKDGDYSRLKDISGHRGLDPFR